MKTIRRKPPFLYYPIHIPQRLESCNPRLIIARCATCFDDIGFMIILSSPQRFHLSPEPSRLGGSPFLQKLTLDSHLGAGEADCVKQHTELVKLDINGSIFRPLFAVPLHCRFQLPQYSLNNPPCTLPMLLCTATWLAIVLEFSISALIFLACTTSSTHLHRITIKPSSNPTIRGSKRSVKGASSEQGDRAQQIGTATKCWEMPPWREVIWPQGKPPWK